MSPKRPFTLTFAPEVIGHLDYIDRKHHSSIRQAIKEQLVHTPNVPTANRKELDQPAPYEATWELRCGPNNRFRILYDVNIMGRQVWILAIGIKEGNRLIIGGEEYTR
jgi:mRNA-degrading endonuclease RelE of RelBE toxin-antitoxin system